MDQARFGHLPLLSAKSMVVCARGGIGGKAGEVSKILDVWQAKALFDYVWCQNFFGALIILSFLLAVIVSEVRPPFASSMDHFFTIIDDVFTGFFTVFPCPSTCPDLNLV